MGRAVAVGFFDGVHLGHKALLSLLKGEAKKRNLSPLVLTFSNHPQEVLGKGSPPRLTTNEERRTLLEAEGVEVAEIPFTPELASLTAKEFGEKVLRKKFDARLLALGEGAKLGRGGETSAREAPEIFRPLGIEVVVQPPVTVEGQIVSSSLIRSLLLEGKVEKALRLLGRPYEISGIVQKGKGRGAKVLLPTCNLNPPKGKLIPKSGVYAALAEVEGQTFPAAVNIGSRPTFEGEGLHIEAHLLGFHRSLYGRPLTLKLLKRLRDERKFPSLEALREQIRHDIEEAKKVAENWKSGPSENPRRQPLPKRIV